MKHFLCSWIVKQPRKEAHTKCYQDVKGTADDKSPTTKIPDHFSISIDSMDLLPKKEPNQRLALLLAYSHPQPLTGKTTLELLTWPWWSQTE